MKLLFAANVFGWRMTGLMGAGGAWFLGFSRKPAELDAERAGSATVHASASAGRPDNVVPGPWLKGAPRLTRAAVRIRRIQRSQA